MALSPAYALTNGRSRIAANIAKSAEPVRLISAGKQYPSPIVNSDQNVSSICPKLIVDAELHSLDSTPGTTSGTPAIVPGNDRLLVLKL